MRGLTLPGRGVPRHQDRLTRPQRAAPSIGAYRSLESAVTEPILVVDIGSWALSAAVVLPDQLHPIREPLTGAPRWPGGATLITGAGRPRLVVGVPAEQARDQHPRQYIDGVR